MNLKRKIVGLISSMGNREFQRICDLGEVYERKLWKEIYKLNKNKRINENLLENPITSLDDYTDFFKEGMRTGVNPLSGERIEFWAQSAGTTGASKVFPITKSYRKQFQKVLKPFINNLLRTYPSFMKNKTLYLAAIDPTEYTDSGSPIGYISNYNYHNISSIIKGFYALPDEVLVDAKTYENTAPLISLASDLSSIFAVTPLSISRFIDSILCNWEASLKELQVKVESGAIEISAERLDYLRSLNAKQLTYKKIWPKLSFICCWKSSVCANQLLSIKDMLEGITVVDAVYSATEGWINVPEADGTIGGAVHPAANILEFIEIGKKIEVKNLMKPWMLESGKEYELFITNKMGLVRYRIGDIVKCTGMKGKAPILHFVRKESSSISLGIVTISENELVSLSHKNEIELGVDKYFAPNKSGDGLYYCFKRTENIEEINEKLKRLNTDLRNINVNYKTYNESSMIKDIIGYKLDHGNDQKWHAQVKPQYLKQISPEVD